MSLFSSIELPYNSAPMSDAETLASLQLYRTENIGPITFYKLISRFGSAVSAIKNLPHIEKRKFTPYDIDKAEEEIELLLKIGGQIIAYNDPAYPQLLKQISDAPPIISILGDASLLNKKPFAIIGARNASLMGRKLTQTLAKDIGEAGYTIISGLARGIDSCAHKASIQTGTIAVIAGGIDVIYPRENKDLYHEIKETGVIVAESPFGTQPQARHFPKRNRIISGLSLGILVVEAALRSGSLITATMAADQNRDVFAVPGSPLDPRAQGTNALIKDSAYMVTNADDVLHILNSSTLSSLSDIDIVTPYQANDIMDMPDKEFNEDIDEITEENTEIMSLKDEIINLLSPIPVLIDEIIRQCSVQPPAVLAIILELELTGHLERHPGNRVSLI